MESVGHTVCTVGHAGAGTGADAGADGTGLGLNRFKEEGTTLSEILANMKRGLTIDGCSPQTQAQAQTQTQTAQWSLR